MLYLLHVGLAIGPSIGWTSNVEFRGHLSCIQVVDIDRATTFLIYMGSTVQNVNQMLTVMQ